MVALARAGGQSALRFRRIHMLLSLFDVSLCDGGEVLEGRDGRMLLLPHGGRGAIDRRVGIGHLVGRRISRAAEELGRLGPAIALALEGQRGLRLLPLAVVLGHRSRQPVLALPAADEDERRHNGDGDNGADRNDRNRGGWQALAA